MNKYGKILCWTRNYDKLWEITNNLISVLQLFANICLYSIKFETFLVYRYSNWNCLIHYKLVFGPSQIFDKFELTFKLWIWRLNKFYQSYLHFVTASHFQSSLTFAGKARVRQGVYFCSRVQLCIPLLACTVKLFVLVMNTCTL